MPTDKDRDSPESEQLLEEEDDVDNNTASENKEKDSAGFSQKAQASIDLVNSTSARASDWTAPKDESSSAASGGGGGGGSSGQQSAPSEVTKRVNDPKTTTEEQRIANEKISGYYGSSRYVDNNAETAKNSPPSTRDERNSMDEEAEAEQPRTLRVESRMPPADQMDRSMTKMERQNLDEEEESPSSQLAPQDRQSPLSAEAASSLPAKPSSSSTLEDAGPTPPTSLSGTRFTGGPQHRPVGGEGKEDLAGPTPPTSVEGTRFAAQEHGEDSDFSPAKNVYSSVFPESEKKEEGGLPAKALDAAKYAAVAAKQGKDAIFPNKNESTTLQSSMEHAKESLEESAKESWRESKEVASNKINGLKEGSSSWKEKAKAAGTVAQQSTLLVAQEALDAVEAGSTSIPRELSKQTERAKEMAQDQFSLAKDVATGAAGSLKDSVSPKTISEQVNAVKNSPLLEKASLGGAAVVGKVAEFAPSAESVKAGAVAAAGVTVAGTSYVAGKASELAGKAYESAPSQEEVKSALETASLGAAAGVGKASELASKAYEAAPSQEEVQNQLESAVGKASEYVPTDKMKELASQASNVAQTIPGKASDIASKAQQSLNAGVRSAESNLSQVASTVAEKTTMGARMAQEEAQSVKEGVSSTVSSTIHAVKEGVSSGARSVENGVSQVAEKTVSGAHAVKDEISQVGSKVVSTAQTEVYAAREVLSEAASNVASTTASGVDALKDGASQAASTTVSGVHVVKDGVSQAAANVASTATSGVHAVKDGIAQAASTAASGVHAVKDGVSEAAANAASTTASGVHAVKDGISEAASSAAATTGSGVHVVKDGISEAASSVASTAASGVHAVRDGVTQAGSKVASTTASTAHVVKDGIAQAASTAASTTASGVNAIKDGVSDIGSRVASTAASGVDAVETGISHVASSTAAGLGSAKDGVASAASNVVSKATSGVHAVEDGVASAASSFVDKSKSGIDTVRHGVSAAEDAASKATASSVRSVEDGLSNAASTVSSTGMKTMHSGAEKAESLVRDAQETVSNVGSSVTDGFRAVEDGVSKVASTLASGVQAVGSGVSQVVTASDNKVATMKEKVGDTVHQATSRMTSADSKVTTGMQPNGLGAKAFEDFNESAPSGEERSELGQVIGETAQVEGYPMKGQESVQGSMEATENRTLLEKDISANGDPSKQVSGKQFAHHVLEAYRENAGIEIDEGENSSKGKGLFERAKRQFQATVGVVMEDLPADFALDLQTEDDEEKAARDLVNAVDNAQRRVKVDRAFGTSSSSSPRSPPPPRTTSTQGVASSPSSSTATTSAVREMASHQDVIASSISSSGYMQNNELESSSTETPPTTTTTTTKSSEVGVPDGIESANISSSEKPQTGLWESIKGRARSLLGMSNNSETCSLEGIEDEGQGNEVGGLDKNIILGNKDALKPGDGASKTGKEMDEIRNRIRAKGKELFGDRSDEEDVNGVLAQGNETGNNFHVKSVDAKRKAFEKEHPKSWMGKLRSLKSKL